MNKEELKQYLISEHLLAQELIARIRHYPDKPIEELWSDVIKDNIDSIFYRYPIDLVFPTEGEIENELSRIEDDLTTKHSSMQIYYHKKGFGLAVKWLQSRQGVERLVYEDQ